MTRIDIRVNVHTCTHIHAPCVATDVLKEEYERPFCYITRTREASSKGKKKAETMPPCGFDRIRIVSRMQRPFVRRLSLELRVITKVTLSRSTRQAAVPFPACYLRLNNTGLSKKFWFILQKIIINIVIIVSKCMCEKGLLTQNFFWKLST